MVKKILVYFFGPSALLVRSEKMAMAGGKINQHFVARAAPGPTNFVSFFISIFSWPGGRTGVILQYLWESDTHNPI
jgi:hypothetical protein